MKAPYLHKIKTGEQTLILADLYAAGNALYEENTNDSYTGHENIRISNTDIFMYIWIPTVNLEMHFDGLHIHCLG